MLPALSVAAGPLVARIAALSRSSSPIISTLSARLNAIGANVGAKADDIIAWVKANPANAGMAALTLGSLGVGIVDLFSSEEEKKVARSAELGQLNLADLNRIDEAGRASQTLDLQIAETAIDVQTAIAILRFAKSFFGSERTAIDGHRLLQAFFEMPRDDVVAGFATLRV